MNAGDELRLRFPKRRRPRRGLVRDFVVVGDGWVKDGDYNTTFSRTVLPLPTHAERTLRRRRRRGSRTIRSTGGTRHDFAEYHTRYVTPERSATRCACRRDAAAVP